jgi:hypothetical protein
MEIQPNQQAPQSAKYFDTLYSPFTQQAKSDLIRWQLDAKDILAEFQHKMRGEVWSHTDPNGNEVYKPEGKALMNEEGINSIMSLISARLSKVFIMSNFSESDINSMMIVFSYELITLMFNKYTAFEIDKAFLPSITNYVEDLVYATLKRALNEGERKFLGTTERRVESYTEGDNKPKSSWASIFKR